MYIRQCYTQTMSDTEKKIFRTGVFLIVILALFASPIFSNKNLSATTGGYGDMYDAVYPVRLDLKLEDIDSRIVGESIISDQKEGELKKDYTIVETIFTARARALGGDLYLPAYREDIVTSPIITVPVDGSHAVVPGNVSIEIAKDLPKVKDKFLLKKYDEVTLRIKVEYKILPKAMPNKLVFATKLSSVLWYPAITELERAEAEINYRKKLGPVLAPATTSSYAPQQLTRVDWVTEPTVLFKSSKTTEVLKNIFSNKSSDQNVANISGVLDRFKKFFIK